MVLLKKINLILVVILTSNLLFLNQISVRSEYVNNESAIEPLKKDNWLLKGLETGAKEGTKAVTKEIISNLAKSIINAYSPAIAEIFFGEKPDDSLKIILDRIDDLDSSLSERQRLQLQEIRDLQETDILASFRTASFATDSWLSSTDVLERIQDLETIRTAREKFINISILIEEHINRLVENEQQVRNISDVKLRRIDLLPLQMMAANLAIVTSQYYYGTLSIDTEFKKRYGSDYSQFSTWRNSLADEEFNRILTSEPRYLKTQEELINSLVQFYEQLCSLRLVENYVDSILTPVVSSTSKFRFSSSEYDIVSRITDSNSWKTSGEVSQILDGIRWYYYAYIPNRECLEGRAEETLIHRSPFFWIEKESDPSDSSCNRSWVISPRLKTSEWPGTTVASFDSFGLWYEDPETAREVHKEKIIADVYAAYYLPALSILDEMIAKSNLVDRDLNACDTSFAERDRLIGILNSSDGYQSGISYEKVLLTENQIKEWGSSIDNIGFNLWSNQLKQSSINPKKKLVYLWVRNARLRNDWMSQFSDSDSFLSITLPNLNTSLLNSHDHSIVLEIMEKINDFEKNNDIENLLNELEEKVQSEAVAKYSVSGM